jgi:hypothetical protein
MSTISTAAAAIAEYLAHSLKTNSSIAAFLGDFTDATVAWLRPVFLKDDGTEKKVVKDLQADPDDKKLHEKVQTLIEAKAEDDEDAATAILTEILEKISAKTGQTFAPQNTSTITGNHNTVVQGVNNSHINIGNITQTHSGSGDNVGRDNIVNHNSYYGNTPVDPANGGIWKTMLSKGKIEEAINHLLDLHKNNAENHNNLLLLLGQYNFNQGNYNRGIIGNDEHTRTRVKITNSLLEMFG